MKMLLINVLQCLTQFENSSYSDETERIWCATGA